MTTNPRETSRTNTPRWVGMAAIAWALDDAPNVPPALVSTLVAVARWAGEDGRNAYPSVETIAVATRKTESQVRRDLRQLRKLGLLLPGDPAVVAKYRADRRPAVYNVPLHLQRDDAVSSTSRGSTHATPHGVAPTPPRDVNEVAPKPERGSTHARHGVAHRPERGSTGATQRIKEESKEESSSSSSPWPRERKRIAAVTGCDDDDASDFIEWAKPRYKIRTSVSGYLHKMTDDEIQAAYDEMQNPAPDVDPDEWERRPMKPPPAPPLPPWCGECGGSERAQRFIAIIDAAGDERWTQCPKCNPASSIYHANLLAEGQKRTQAMIDASKHPDFKGPRQFYDEYDAAQSSGGTPT